MWTHRHRAKGVPAYSCYELVTLPGDGSYSSSNCSSTRRHPADRLWYTDVNIDAS
jgi:hypothetical protein